MNIALQRVVKIPPEFMYGFKMFENYVLPSN